MFVEFKPYHDTRTMIYFNGLSHSVDCVPKDAEVIGLKLGVFKQVNGVIALQDGSHSAILQIQDVLNTSDKHIVIARRQMEDAGVDTSTLSGLDVAIMDVIAREQLALAAKEIDDPFNPVETSPWSNRTARIPMPDWQSVFDGYTGEDA